MEQIVLDPLLPWPVLVLVAAISVLVVLLALWRGLPGWWLRFFAGFALLAALAGPSLRDEDRDPLRDVAFVVIDESASQSIDVRPDQMSAIEPKLMETLAGLSDDGLDIVTLRVADGKEDRGTQLMGALVRAAAEHSTERIAGAILITDGQVDDTNLLESFPAPVHVLLSGRSGEWDRRLVIETAPSYAIVGEETKLKLKIETLGTAPSDLSDTAVLEISVQGETPRPFNVPIGRSIELPIELSRGGENVFRLTVRSHPDELTERNNEALITINGVRDRLRVLLVSGEPHAGERTWRNLLKADTSVDLVHFTILRPLEKQDGVPVYELSLIAFPTRELFMEKIDEFDLIIFDRYRRRGLLPSLYLENVVRYVEDGGAVLVASGPAYAGVESLHRTALQRILPVEPTGQVIEEGYLPLISDLGKRHPVTRALEAYDGGGSDENSPEWGRWFRLIETAPVSGNVVMEGPDERPLLVLDRAGEGRIAVLASDHAWLWSRGYEGGGPQLEMLRRLAHWLMKEPELEEEVLQGRMNNGLLRITRQTLGGAVGTVTVTMPDGTKQDVTLVETGPGRWEAELEVAQNGLYRLREGDVESVAAVGPASPKEFEDPVSGTSRLAGIMQTSGGGMLRIEDHPSPQIRQVREGRTAFGRGWLGLNLRQAYDVRDIRLTPLLPAWAWMLLAGLLALGAWRVEGR